MSETQEELLVVYYCWCWHKNKALFSRTPFFWNYWRIVCIILFTPSQFFIWKTSRLALKSQIVLEHDHLSVPMITFCHIRFDVLPCHFVHSPLETLFTLMASIINSRILPKTNLRLFSLLNFSLNRPNVGLTSVHGYSAVTSNSACWKLICLSVPLQISWLISIFL